MLKPMSKIIKGSGPSSLHSSILTYHFLSFKPLLSRYLDLQFILTESLVPGLDSIQSHEESQTESEFQSSLQDEAVKSTILEYIKSLKTPPLDPSSLSDLDSLQTTSISYPNALMPAGRINHIKKNKRKIMIEQFLLSSKHYFDHYSKTETLMIVPQLENPSEVVPISFWSNYTAKLKAYEKILNSSKYFYQELELKEAKFLKKFKFGDFPFERFLYESQFNFMNKNEDQDMKDVKKLDKKEIFQKISKFVKKVEENLLVSKKTSFKKSFFYYGDDFEMITREINALRGFEAKFEVRGDGDRVIHVVYQVKNVVDPDDVEYLFGKYGNELRSGLDEIEIDEGDQEKMEKMMRLGKTPDEIYKIYLESKVKSQDKEV